MSITIYIIDRDRILDDNENNLPLENMNYNNIKYSKKHKIISICKSMWRGKTEK